MFYAQKTPGIGTVVLPIAETLACMPILIVFSVTKRVNYAMCHHCGASQS